MAGPRAMGLIEGIADATASLFKLASGVLMDRSQHAKPWIVTGYALAGLGRPLVAFATSWLWVLLIRLVDRVGKGLRTSPRDALLAASVDPEQRGLAFGLHRGMDNGGAVIGPLLAAALLAAHVPLRSVFLWAIVPGLVTLALTFAIREPHTPYRLASPAFSWRLAGLPSELKRYLITASIFTLGNASNMFLLLRAKELGVADAHIPLLWAVLSLVAMLCAAPLAALSDRFGRTRLIEYGWILYALFYLLLGFLELSLPMLYLLFVSYGTFLAATEGVEKALVADLAPSTLRGTAYGWFNLATGLALFPASLLFGWFYQAQSPAFAFGFSAACAVLATLLLRYWVGAPQRSL